MRMHQLFIAFKHPDYRCMLGDMLYLCVQVVSAYLERAVEIIRGERADYRLKLLNFVVASGEAGNQLLTIHYIRSKFEGASAAQQLEPEQVAGLLQLDGDAGAQHRFVEFRSRNPGSCCQDPALLYELAFSIVWTGNRKELTDLM